MKFGMDIGLQIRVTIQTPIRKTAVSQRSLRMGLLRHIKSVKCALECKHSDHIYQILHGSE